LLVVLKKKMMVGSSRHHLLQRKGKSVADKGAAAATTVAAEKVVVAVRAATREISKTAIIWALTHVVQPGGSIILLVVIPAHSSGIVSGFSFPVWYIRISTSAHVLQIHGFYRLVLLMFLWFCSSCLKVSARLSISGRKFWGFPLFAGDCASGHKSMLDQKCDLSELCSQMLKKIDVYDIDKVWRWG
jgi:hypothetical protein